MLEKKSRAKSMSSTMSSTNRVLQLESIHESLNQGVNEIAVNNRTGFKSNRGNTLSCFPRLVLYATNQRRWSDEKLKHLEP